MAITNNGRFHLTRKKKRKNHLLDTSFFCFLSKIRKMNENCKTLANEMVHFRGRQRKRTPLAFRVLDTDETDSNKRQKKVLRKTSGILCVSREAVQSRLPRPVRREAVVPLRHVISVLNRARQSLSPRHRRAALRRFGGRAALGVCVH